MTDPVQVAPARLYPEIESYVLQRTKEFDQISNERRSELLQLANYVGDSIAGGQEARLTFVCTHNSRRSHMTQIWTQIAAAYFGWNHVQTFSGGTEVTACNPRTVAALKRCGLRFSTWPFTRKQPETTASHDHHSESPIADRSRWRPGSSDRHASTSSPRINSTTGSGLY